MFFSEAIALIEPILCINHWKVLYKICVFYVDRNSKMTTTAGHSFYIGPIGSFYNQVNDTGSWEPLVLLMEYFGEVYVCLMTCSNKGEVLHIILKLADKEKKVRTFIIFQSLFFFVWLQNNRGVMCLLSFICRHNGFGALSFDLALVEINLGDCSHTYFQTRGPKVPKSFSLM